MKRRLYRHEHQSLQKQKRAALKPVGGTQTTSPNSQNPFIFSILEEPTSKIKTFHSSSVLFPVYFLGKQTPNFLAQQIMKKSDLDKTQRGLYRRRVRERGENKN